MKNYLVRLLAIYEFPRSNDSIDPEILSILKKASTTVLMLEDVKIEVTSTNLTLGEKAILYII